MRRRRGQNRDPATGEPVALDPASGFKVPHKNLVRQWDSEFVDHRFVDKRNPQDLIRTRPDKPNLPHPRPEPGDSFMASPILWEDGGFMLWEDGGIMYGEGLIVTAESL